jgi:hypothetical protein
MDERKNKLEIDRECESCKGTGLYVGMAENNGAAVVCHTCKGEGHYEETIEWTEFKRLKERKGVKRVFAASCGIGIGEGLTKEGRILKLEDFGGLEYEFWLSMKNKTKFPKYTEMREFTCPAWFWQSVDYDKKPEWKECQVFGSFSACPRFDAKQKCWEKYDRVGKGKQ